MWKEAEGEFLEIESRKSWPRHELFTGELHQQRPVSSRFSASNHSFFQYPVAVRRKPTYITGGSEDKGVTYIFPITMLNLINFFPKSHIVNLYKILLLVVKHMESGILNPQESTLALSDSADWASSLISLRPDCLLNETELAPFS